MISSSQEIPTLLHLFNTQASLGSIDYDDSNHSTRKLFDEILLSPVRSQTLFNPNKKIVVGDESWLRRGVSNSSEASSPERQFERQEFFSQFRVPIKLCEEHPYQEQKLQHFSKNAVNFIDSETLYKNADELTLFDCRYQYEYDGGHIQGATHLSNPLDIESVFFKQIPSPKPIIVLYCEFSEKRSLKIYEQIRNQDRNLNVYPKLHYPDLYVLDKGFSNFQMEYPNNIEGQYIEMNNKEYKNQYCEQKWQNEKQWQQLKSKKRLIK